MLKGIAAVIGGILLLVALGIGTWQLGWFVEEKNTDKRAQVNQRTYGRQDALAQAMVDDFQEVTELDVMIVSATDGVRTALVAQRNALVDQICDNASRYTETIDLPANISNFIERECL